MELRIERCLTEQTRWTIGLVLLIYALVLATILTVAIAAMNIQSKPP